ncbi:MAG: HAD-IA family hydrolase [Tsuneonella sp.]
MPDARAPVCAVVFDVGKVLYQWDMRRLFEQLIEDREELDRFLAEVISIEWHSQHDAGRPAADMIAERSAEFPHYADHIRAWRDRFNETLPGPVPGSLEIVEALAAGGVPLYAITNFGADTWAGFRPTAPVFDHFRAIVVSGDEKLVKPDAPIFHLAERRFGHLAGEMLFVDDNAANIAAARALGWQVHHFTDAATLAEDLRQRGLLR